MSTLTTLKMLFVPKTKRDAFDYLSRYNAEYDKKINLNYF